MFVVAADVLTPPAASHFHSRPILFLLEKIELEHPRTKTTKTKNISDIIVARDTIDFMTEV